MDYQEIENRLVDYVHKVEGKDYPIHDLKISTAVEFAIELVKNCSIPDVVKSLPQDTDGCSNDRDKCSCKDWGGCPVD